MVRKILILTILSTLVLGCDVFLPKKDDEDTSTTEFIATPPPVKGMLLAQVNDWAIGTGDFKEQLKTLKTLYPQIDVADRDAKRKILADLVDFEILAQHAETKGMDQEPDVMKAVKDFKRTYLAQKLLEQLSKKVIVTEREIQQYYNSNKLNLREPEERKVREVVVSTEAEAKEIGVKLLQGESFSILARQRSTADSKRQSGDLGYLTLDPNTRFDKFWEKVFTTEEGEVSNHFRGPKGYYIIKVEAIRGGKEKPLSNIKDDIKEFLRQEKIAKEKGSIVSDARQKFDVKINQHLLN